MKVGVFSVLQTLGVAFDVVPASPDSIHSAKPVLRSERIDLSLGLSNSRSDLMLLQLIL